jgi:hypothetical protein
MKMKTKLSLLIAVVCTFALASVSMASTITVNGTNFFLTSTTSANLNTAGTTQASNNGIVFGTVTIDMASTIPAINSSDYIRVDDNRGKNAGWNVSVSALDFTANGIIDQSVASGTINVSIPASTILTLSPQSPTSPYSSELANVTAQNTGNTAVTSGGIKVLNAAKGYGQGVYTQQLNYTLTMPNYLPSSSVITATDSTSKFLTTNRTTGAKIGLFEGTYTSTISYSITTGP